MPSQDRTQVLVLDTAPLLTSSLSSLLRFSNRFVTTQDVIEEVRGKGQRERLEKEWKTLGATLNTAATQENGQWAGLQVKEPSTAGISKIKEFATKTGDIAVLSSADIRVLALAYDVEVEANGTWRLRETLGGRRMGKDPEKKKARQLRKLQQQNTQETPVQSNVGSSPEDPIPPNSNPTPQSLESSASSNDKTSPANPPDVDLGNIDRLTAQTSQLSLDSSSCESKISQSATIKAFADPHEAFDLSSACSETPSDCTNPIETVNTLGWSQVPIKVDKNFPEVTDACSVSSSCVSTSDPSWITPENVHIHQAKDLGLFPSLNTKYPMIPFDPSSSSTVQQEKEDDHNAEVNSKITLGTAGDSSSKPPTMKAAILTGDFAMQNVALQIGLNVLGAGGKRIRDVKTWILRCYGCFKLCKDPSRKFCPTCGGPTLTRVSITYTPSSPTGYILHLNPNFQYRNRGTVYSIPSAKPGSSSFEKGGNRQKKSINGATLVLREDQKEFQRGLKSVMIQKQKEERKLARASQEPNSSPFSSFGGWSDPDWEPPMLLGEKGRKSNGRNNRNNPNQVRYGKDGLPVIGFGKNPNAVGRGGKR